ncbi:hypothetical protein EYF80_018862 [Liparis tanakae]|uniref:F-box domain-containing protein n=1 Tax=Liparis tanakae TaxID=230148 RepID=A0A4Z2HYR5_9TELE|nr:hypothetical protein EYF80_018862 [Liparis tanakae]
MADAAGPECVRPPLPSLFPARALVMHPEGLMELSGIRRWSSHWYWRGGGGERGKEREGGREGEREGGRESERDKDRDASPPPVQRASRPLGSLRTSAIAEAQRELSANQRAAQPTLVPTSGTGHVQSGHSGQQAARLKGDFPGRTGPGTSTFTGSTFLVPLEALPAEEFVQPVRSSSSSDDSKQRSHVAEPGSNTSIAHAASVVAMEKLESLVNAGRLERIIAAWRNVAKDSRRAKVYFKRLKMGFIEIGYKVHQTEEGWDGLSVLPTSLSTKIFQFLELRDLLNCAEVAKVWHGEEDLLAKSPQVVVLQQQGCKACQTLEGPFLH